MLPRPLNNIISAIVPFIVLGGVLAFAVILLVFFFYLFLWGAGIGLALFIINSIVRRFSPPAATPRAEPPANSASGQIYDHQDQE